MKIGSENFIRLSFALVLVSVILSCEKLVPKKTKDLSAISGALLDTASPIYFDRVGTKTKAQLTFSTTKPTFCEIHLWALNPKEKPKQNSPLKTSCPKASTHHKLLIEPLDPSVLYTIAIYNWVEGESIKKYKPFIFNESQSGHTVVGKRTESKSDLIIAKIDLPLGTGVLHRHPRKTDFLENEIQNIFSEKSGCSTKKEEQSSFGTSVPIIRLEGLATRGYATGSGKSITNQSDRLSINFSKTIQRGDLWEWNFKLGGESFTFPMSPPASIESIKINTGDVRILDRVNFDKNLKNITMQPGESLGFSWKVTGNKNNSKIFIQVGHASLSNAIYCQFDASEEVVTIDSKLLSALAEGSHYLLIRLEQYHFQKIENSSVPSWLIKTFDWRAAKLEKL